MNVNVDRVPPLRLTLDDSIRIGDSAHGQWARIVGLAVDGDRVLVTCVNPDVQLRLLPDVRVAVHRAGAVNDTLEEFGVEERIADYYAGDVDAAGAAVTDHRTDHEPIPSSRVAPELPRNPDLVGIYGGDLDHIVDALGGTTDAQARARRDEALQRSLAEHAENSNEKAEQPNPDAEAEAEELVAQQMAGWYAGDLGAVVENRDR
jgi:hypothetical protein